MVIEWPINLVEVSLLTSKTASCLYTATYYPFHKLRWTRHAWHCSRRKIWLVGNFLPRIPTREHTSVGQQAKTLCVDTGCHLANLRAMPARDRCKESQRNLCCQYTLMRMRLYIYIYMYVILLAGLIIHWLHPLLKNPQEKMESPVYDAFVVQKNYEYFFFFFFLHLVLTD